MTDSRMRDFNKELGQLLAKYRLRALVGIIYDTDTRKLKSGLVRLYDPADTAMKTITGLISDIMTRINNDAMGSTPISEYRDLTGGSGKEKN